MNGACPPRQAPFLFKPTVDTTAYQCRISRFAAQFSPPGFQVLRHPLCEGKIEGLQELSN
jgi:hypothetical protein